MQVSTWLSNILFICYGFYCKLWLQFTQNHARYRFQPVERHHLKLVCCFIRICFIRIWADTLLVTYQCYHCSKFTNNRNSLTLKLSQYCKSDSAFSQGYLSRSAETAADWETPCVYARRLIRPSYAWLLPQELSYYFWSKKSDCLLE